MNRELAGPLQHTLDLYSELSAADPSALTSEFRFDNALSLVRLAICGNKSAFRTMTEDSQSSKKADAVVGKAGLLMYRWCVDPKAQQSILANFQVLAKANPKDDVLVYAILDMAQYQSTSDELSSDMRDIVDRDLTGNAAEKYHHEPNKIDRPFKVAVNVVGGETVSTADWKG